MKARKKVPNVEGAITREAVPRSVAGAQHVGVIDVGGASHHRVHQRQHLAARPGAAHPADQTHHHVDDASARAVASLCEHARRDSALTTVFAIIERVPT